MTLQGDTPQPCLRKMRCVTDGPLVAARIYRDCRCTIGGGDDSELHPWTMACDRYPHLEAEINDKPVEPWRVWTWGEDIQQHEYDYLIKLRRHIDENEPWAGDADPYKPIDWSTLGPPTGR